MEIYLDIIYIINCILGCFCLLSLSILTGKIISIKKCLVLSLIWGIHIITLYFSEWIYYLWVFMVVFLFERKHIVREFFLFIIIHETYLNSLSNIYRIGNVLIVTEKFDCGLPLLVGSLIICLYLCLLFQFRRESMYQQLVYDVIVKIDHIQYPLKGFLDTGNQTLYEGLPIVFLKESKVHLQTNYAVSTFLEKEQIYVINGEIFFKNQWMKCAFSILERLEIQEDCLLNYYLL